MQTLVDIPEEDVTLLNKLSEDRQVPRDELVRTAVSIYLRTNAPLKANTPPKMTEAEEKAVMDKAFGSWADFPEDGLAYPAEDSRRMGPVAPLLDTNILLDYLKGIPLAIAEIDRSVGPAISVISWMEVWRVALRRSTGLPASPE